MPATRAAPLPIVVPGLEIEGEIAGLGEDANDQPRLRCIVDSQDIFAISLPDQHPSSGRSDPVEKAGATISARSR
jgi:hypothetical protein